MGGNKKYKIITKNNINNKMNNRCKNNNFLIKIIFVNF